jgi:hypothetical protein
MATPTSNGATNKPFARQPMSGKEPIINRANADFDTQPGGSGPGWGCADLSPEETNMGNALPWGEDSD